jgi:HEPN domain-containing protein
MKPHLEEAALMLRMADRDIVAFQVLSRAEDVHLSIVCFHAQQAIEKCFKAVLFCHLIEFRRTHDLFLLAELLNENEITVPLSVRQIATLNPCAVRLRYDDVEVEVEYITREELAEITTITRAWAERLFKAADDSAQARHTSS